MVIPVEVNIATRFSWVVTFITFRLPPPGELNCEENKWKT